MIIFKLVNFPDKVQKNLGLEGVDRGEVEVGLNDYAFQLKWNISEKLKINRKNISLIFNNIPLYTSSLLTIQEVGMSDGCVVECVWREDDSKNTSAILFYRFLFQIPRHQIQF
jgi:hypothetical protein